MSSYYIDVLIGTNLSLIVQYAYGSEGYGNIGTGFTFNLRVSPNNSQLADYYLFQNVPPSDVMYMYNHSFTVMFSALFTFQGMLLFYNKLMMFR